MTAHPVLEIVNASKSFPGVRALDAVNMTIDHHEVVGIVGENGAGKSTLLRVLTGVHGLDEGEVRMNGRPTEVTSPRSAAENGIAMVFQEQSVLPGLSVAENIFLGREREFVRAGFLARRRLREAARRELAKVRLEIDPGVACAELSFAQRQMVELAKALSLDERNEGHLVILLDEPTSVLEAKEIELLFRIIRELKSRATFVFISHRLDEVLQVSDRIYVMRDGKVVGEMPAAGASLSDLHKLMVGRELHAEYYRENLQQAYSETVVMEVDGLRFEPAFRDVSFKLHGGEILGIAGVIGSGREELAQCLAGLKAADGGSIRVGGQAVTLNTPWKAVQTGIGYLPRERKTEGLVGLNTVAENMTMAAIDRVTRRQIIDFGAEKRLARTWIERLNIKTPSPATPAGSLSGGNQQKVVLSKWRIAGSRIMV
ncbi:MAG: sugar ABC transporter ATP-binding protein, partial [Gammaproteobacteria bacterium]